MARTRLEADLRAAARNVAEESGTRDAGTLSADRIASLDDALADSAGVPTVVAAVEKSTRMRAGRATGWPVVSWLSKLKPDPLRRLHLDLGSAGKQLTATARTSVPAPTQVQRARVNTEVRTVAEDVSKDLTRPWTAAIRSASTSRLPDLGDRLDSALASTALGATKIPVWAGVVRVLQWMLILAAIGGALWLGVLAVFGYLQIDTGDSPQAAGLPLPTLLLLGGVAVGLLLALVCRVLVSLTARNRARVADRRLRTAISTVSRDLVVQPIEGELSAYDRVRRGLTEALS